MTRGLIFWVIMLLWFLAILGAFFGPPQYQAYIAVGSTVLHFVLFALLGWQVFGPAIKG